ncbi:unnamed protein product [Moneuplotes crassus]|uniref:PHD-type domain-containing protein n=1 Tax=Euplotes crassus TaxID=5936 RepID=A0AAD2DC60_EUPCR|nr:unnamed protein product [Moneuplotes crassus]
MIDLQGLKLKNPSKLSELSYERIRVKNGNIISKENYCNLDTARCDICLKDYCQIFEDGSNDDLIMCDVCKVLVHQSCYGRDILSSIPEGDWLCERCIYLLYKGRKRKCAFCLDHSGAIIQCNIVPGENQQIKLKSPLWTHITCANWIGGIVLEGDNISFDKELLPGKEWCEVCRKPGEFLIACDYENCEIRWHVRCAIKIQVITPSEQNEEGEGDEKSEDTSKDPNTTENSEEELLLYCQEHQKLQKRLSLGTTVADSDSDIPSGSSLAVIHRLEERIRSLQSTLKIPPKPEEEVTPSVNKPDLGPYQPVETMNENLLYDELANFKEIFHDIITEVALNKLKVVNEVVWEEIERIKNRDRGEAEENLLDNLRDRCRIRKKIMSGLEGSEEVLDIFCGSRNGFWTEYVGGEDGRQGFVGEEVIEVEAETSEDEEFTGEILYDNDQFMDDEFDAVEYEEKKEHDTQANHNDSHSMTKQKLSNQTDKLQNPPTLDNKQDSSTSDIEMSQKQPQGTEKVEAMDAQDPIIPTTQHLDVSQSKDFGLLSKQAQALPTKEPNASKTQDQDDVVMTENVDPPSVTKSTEDDPLLSKTDLSAEPKGEESPHRSSPFKASSITKKQSLCNSEGSSQEEDDYDSEEVEHFVDYVAKKIGLKNFPTYEEEITYGPMPIRKKRKVRRKKGGR